MRIETGSTCHQDGWEWAMRSEGDESSGAWRSNYEREGWTGWKFWMFVWYVIGGKLLCHMAYITSSSGWTDCQIWCIISETRIKEQCTHQQVSRTRMDLMHMVFRLKTNFKYAIHFKLQSQKHIHHIFQLPWRIPTWSKKTILMWYKIFPFHKYRSMLHIVHWKNVAAI